MRKFKNDPYTERLLELDLLSLEQQSLRGALTETYKILKGIENINCSCFLTTQSNCKRYEEIPENYLRGDRDGYW